MAKFDIPRFKWLFQDGNGDTWLCTAKPAKDFQEWLGGGMYMKVEPGKENPNWRDALIDLDKDDYDFEDGILRRIDK